MKVSPPASNTMWDGQWHAVVGTYDGAAVRLWVDGQQVGCTPASGPIGYGLGVNNDFIIGGALAPACSEQTNFTGDVDEVARLQPRAEPRGDRLPRALRPHHPARTADPWVAAAARTNPVVVPDEVIKPPQMLVAAGSGQTATLGCGGRADHQPRRHQRDDAVVQARAAANEPARHLANTLVSIPRTAKLVASTPTYKVSATDAGDKIVCVQTGKTFNGASLVTASPINIYSPVGGSKLFRVPSTYGDFRVRGIDVFQITQPSAGAQMFGFPIDAAFGTTCGGGTPTGYVGPGCAKSADPTRVAYAACRWTCASPRRRSSTSTWPGSRRPRGPR